MSPPRPTVWQYLAFSFFLPVIFVGPINSYSTFYSEPFPSRAENADIPQALLRMLVGFVKYTFLSSMLSEFGYGIAFLGDSHLHGRADLILAVLLYPLFLFCNFSGLCDIAIGASKLMGISVMENFDQPFRSRNFQEFWSRWHISLSTWMRVMVFTPVVKSLSRRVGPSNSRHVIALGLMLCFILIGLWHGLTVNFVLFGFSQGLGVVYVHYMTDLLKRKLSKAQYLRYRNSIPMYWVGAVSTYLYFAATLFLFANTIDHARFILSNIR